MKGLNEWKKTIDSNVINIWNDIDLKYKLTFGLSLIIGILSHGTALFNKFAVHDEAAYYLLDRGMTDWWLTGGTYKAGRWMLGLIGQFAGFINGDNISSASFAGIISIIFLALSACFIIATLRVESIIVSVVIGCLLVTCPVITGLFGFMYIAPQYLLGLLIGYVGVWLICNHRSILKWIVGVILMSASVGVYQAFIPCILIMMLMSYIKDLCFYDKSLKELIYDLFYYGVSSLVFMVLYFAINKLFLNYLGFEMIEYKGVNNMMFFSSIPSRLINVYKYFFVPDSCVSGVVFPMTVRYIYYFCIALWAMWGIGFAIKKESNENMIVKRILVFGSFLLIPFCVSFIYLECDKQYVVGHMAYGQMMFFVFIMFMVDYLYRQYSSRTIVKYFTTAVCAIMCFVCCFYMRFDSITYVKAEIGQERLINWGNTLVTRIQSVDGYDDTYPVIFVGANEKKDFNIKDIDDLSIIIDTPYFDIEELINDYSFDRFLSIWTGYTPNRIYDINMVIHRDQYKEMTCYPDEGSIAVIDGKVVVKFAE